MLSALPGTASPCMRRRQPEVYDTDTGATAHRRERPGTIGDDQRVTLDCEEDGFVWMELRDADSYEIAAIRVYGPEGLVSDLSQPE